MAYENPGQRIGSFEAALALKVDQIGMKVPRRVDVQSKLSVVSLISCSPFKIHLCASLRPPTSARRFHPPAGIRLEDPRAGAYRAGDLLSVAAERAASYGVFSSCGRARLRLTGSSRRSIDLAVGEAGLIIR